MAVLLKGRGLRCGRRRDRRYRRGVICHGRLEDLLRRLVLQQSPALLALPVAGIRTEIAQVRSAGGDLVAHFKEKGRQAMRQEAAAKKLRKASKSNHKGDN